ATPHDDTLALTLPSDGSQHALRTLLDRLDTHGIEADELTVHTPDLDDVFFALTAHDDTTETTTPATPVKETTR
ncbi:ABC transporter, partial [Streptomyces sp. NPDC057682]